MGWWKADPVPEARAPTDVAVPTPTPTPVAPHPILPSDSASECPVDTKTRSIWLQAAQAKQKSGETKSQIATSISASNYPPVPTAVASSQECSSDRIDQSLPSTSSQTHSYKPGTLRPLSQEREISSIPRGNPGNLPSSKDAIPSNSESETGHDKSSGNWIYPSETQFFNAVMRKQTAASPKELATSISSIIPIHNAVNERAWHMIRSWEGTSSNSCGGPKLLRFEGKGAGARSPRAQMKSWSGYTEPFDRHDWTVQRCDGTEVEYVIDFYQGRASKVPPGMEREAGSSAEGLAGGLNFYLDVRPKLNTLEGCKMRFERALGWR